MTFSKQEASAVGSDSELKGAHLGGVKVEDLERLKASRPRQGNVSLAFLQNG